MLKKLSKKSLLLFVGVLAVSALAGPSMASAASWGTVGTTHVLDSTNLGFFAQGANAGSSCALSRFHADVTSAAVLTITGGSFTNCVGTNATANCTATVTGTKFPWTVTGITTSNIQIHGVHIDIRWDNRPGLTCPAPFLGSDITLTGTLGIGTAGQTAWDAVAHQVTLTNTTGLTAHALGQPLGTIVNGTIRDNTQTLTLT